MNAVEPLCTIQKSQVTFVWAEQQWKVYFTFELWMNRGFFKFLISEVTCIVMKFNLTFQLHSD